MHERAAGQGFPRHSRLTRPRQFREVFRSNHRSVDPCFLVLARKNGLDHARLGLAVSRRYLRTNVLRNRVKRLIRESFRKNQAQLAGLDVVVVSQRQAGHADNRRLSGSLHRHWEKISK